MPSRRPTDISMVIVFVVMIAVSLVPMIGSLVFQVLQAVIAGGFVVACRSLEKGDDFDAGEYQRQIARLVVTRAWKEERP